MRSPNGKDNLKGPPEGGGPGTDIASSDRTGGVAFIIGVRTIEITSNLKVTVVSLYHNGVYVMY